MEECCVERVFLSWEKPFLESVAEYLFSRFTSGSTCDLQDLLLVAPVSRAARRLEELLVERADAEELWLIPPAQIISTGDLPERVIHGESGDLAGRMERTGAWSSVLTVLSPEQQSTLFGSDSRTFQESDLYRIAEQLDDIAAELGGANLSFGDVAAFFESGKTAFFDKRWASLAELYAAYERTLDEHHLTDRNRRRREVLLERGELSQDMKFSKEIILLGTVDLLPIHKELLKRYPLKVTSLIFAPEDVKEGFDTYGGLLSEYWVKSAQCAIADDQILPATNPYHQAAVVAAKVSEYGGSLAADQISVGVTADQYIPYLEQQLVVHDVPCRVAGGTPFLFTPVLRLLEGISRLLESGSFLEFSALVRHPDMLKYVSKKLSVPNEHYVTSRKMLRELDAFQEQHLQSSIFQSFPEDEKLTLPEKMRSCVHDLLKGLLQGPDKISELRQPVLDIIKKIYGEKREFKENSPSDAACIEVFRGIADVSEEAAEMELFSDQRISPSQFLRILLRELSRRSTTPQPTGAAVEILGWLELAFDDAPALVIAGMNEGQVPESLNEDLFLPDSLRTHLGLTDNSRRFARDIYSLKTMLNSKEKLTLCFSRHAGNGDPQQPSRLLYLESDEDKLVGRVKRFTTPLVDYVEEEKMAKEEVPLFFIEEPDLTEYEPSPIMRVTEFRDYLHCPYRYYLKNIVRTRRASDELFELDGARYGTFIHAALCDFGTSPLCHSTDSSDIYSFLADRVEERAKEEFGSKPLPAVLVQIEQMKVRLRTFAAFQESWRAQGWEIEQVEFSPGKDNAVPLTHSEGSTGIYGTIDRIDRHRDGSFIIIDYKTGDAGRSPDKAHRDSEGDWLDLQLPLYEYLLKEKGVVEQECQLAYLPLGALDGTPELLFAHWSREERESAIETARNVAAAVKRGEFWPPSEFVSAFDDYADILGVGQFGAHYILEQAAGE